MGIRRRKKKKDQAASFIVEDQGLLTSEELRMIRAQIQANRALCDYYVQRIDLMVNKEKCPLDAVPLLEMRSRLSVAMAENDTFRNVLWRHTELYETQNPFPGKSVDPIAFLISRIRSREWAMSAQSCSQ